jgi:hypothetical protein
MGLYTAYAGVVLQTGQTLPADAVLRACVGTGYQESFQCGALATFRKGSLTFQNGVCNKKHNRKQSESVEYRISPLQFSFFVVSF